MNGSLAYVYYVCGEPLPLLSAVLVTDSLRAALQSMYGRETGGRSSPFFSGKDEEGRPSRGGNRHAHFLLIDEDGDGMGEFLVVYAPDIEMVSLEEEAAAISLGIDGKLSIPGLTREGVELSLVHLGDPSGSCLSPFRRAKKWKTHTPMVLGRHPHPSAGRDLPEEQVRRELGEKGFPPPVGVSVELAGKGWRIRRRRKRLASDLFFHVLVEFGEEVQGPMFLGCGEHFGLGVLTPA